MRRKLIKLVRNWLVLSMVLAGPLLLSSLPVTAQDTGKGRTEVRVSVPERGIILSVSAPDKVVLTYSETGKQSSSSSTPCEGGSIIKAGPECITKQIGAADANKGGGEQEKKASATLTIPLTPKLELIKDSYDHMISLKVGRHDFKVSGLSQETEKKVRREAAMVLRNLKKWRKSTEAFYSLADQLRSPKGLTTSVNSPFAMLKLLSKPDLKLTVREQRKIEPPKLRFVERESGGFRTIAETARGMPFFIEAEYRDAPDEDKKKVFLRWPGCTLDLEVTVARTKERTVDDGYIYRSKAFYVAETPVPAGRGKMESAADYVEGSYSWFFGAWDVTYNDRGLGQIKGRAVVSPKDKKGGLGSIEITLRYPKTGKEYRLTAYDTEETEHILTVKLRGRSPPSGWLRHESFGPNDMAGATPLRVPAGIKKLFATLDKVRAETGIIEGLDLTLDLDTGFRKREDKPGVIPGVWRYVAPKNQIKYRRASRIKEVRDTQLREVEGIENWTRAPFTLKSVETMVLHHGEFGYGKDVLGTAWLRFHGDNLPVQPGRKVEIKFADPTVRYTGNYSANPADPSVLNAEVVIKRGIDEKPKKVTLNGVPVIWNLDLKDFPHTVRFVRKFREDQYEPINEVYFGEIFYVEAEYANEPLTARPKYLVVAGKKKEKAVEVELTKVPSRGAILRSPPMLLLEESAKEPRPSDFSTNGGESVPSDYPKGIKTIIRAKDGTTLLSGQKAKGPRQKGKIPIGAATALARPPSEWEKALKRARACRKKYPDRYSVSNWTLTDAFTPGGGASRIRRTIQVKTEQHAAMLLLRKELTSRLKAHTGKLRASPPSAETMLLLAKQQRPHPLYDPLFFRKVSRGQSHWGFDWYLRDALSAQRYFTRKDEQGRKVPDPVAFMTYAREAVNEAHRKTVALATLAMKRADKPRDCDIEGLLKLVGVGVEPVIRRVVPTLVRPPRNNEPRYPSLLPDRMARGWVESVRNLAQAIKAQGAYADLDTQLLIGVAMAPLSAYSLIAAAQGMVTAGTAAAGITAFGVDATQAGSDWYKYYQAKKDVAYARGIQGVAGREAARIAEAEAEAKLFSAGLGTAFAGLSALGAGVDIYALAASKGIAPSRKAVKGVFDKVKKISGKDPQLKQLSHSESQVYNYMKGRAKFNLARNAGNLDDTAILRYANRAETAANAPTQIVAPRRQPGPGTERFLPLTSRDPGIGGLDTRLGDDFRWALEPPGTVRFPPPDLPPGTVRFLPPDLPPGTVRFPPPDLPPGTVRFPPPDLPPGTVKLPSPDLPPEQRFVTFKNQDGVIVRVPVGKYLGGGSSSQAFEHAGNIKRVVRENIPVESAKDVAYRLNAEKLDEFGRTVLEGKRNYPGWEQVNNDIVRVVKRFDKGKTPVGGNVEIVEFREPAVNKFSKQPGGQMTDEQAVAVDRATRELNSKGYAWLDNKPNNYGFDENGRVVFLDPGGIVPMKGKTAAERAKNAHALQAEINNPPQDVLDSWETVKRAPEVIKGDVLIQRQKAILAKHGKNIDLQAMDLKDIKDVKFNPGGMFNYKNAQEMFRLEPNQAAKKFKELIKRLKEIKAQKACGIAPGALKPPIPENKDRPGDQGPPKDQGLLLLPGERFAVPTWREIDRIQSPRPIPVADQSTSVVPLAPAAMGKNRLRPRIPGIVIGNPETLPLAA